MPRATVLKTVERFELKTVPETDTEEGGWVELRRLSYGEKLAKDAEAMRMRLGMDSTTKNIDAEVSIINELATYLEFARCVAGHNLTDENDKALDFTKAHDVKSLDPRVGAEISELIGDLNDFERSSSTSSVDGSGK
jgi:hypothetical protein